MQASKTLYSHFRQYFDQEAKVSAYAPGRVNLIGDHTDYNQGFVLPAAINFGTHVLACKRQDSLINVVALDINEQSVCFDLNDIQYDTRFTWSNYVRGVLLELKSMGFAIQGADILISGDVPQGAGLSSSASLEIALISAFAKLNQFELSGVDAALTGQKVENNFVGCNCGIMDQLISALGKKSHAMMLDCRSLTYDYAKLPDDMAIMIVNSNVKRELVDSEYNTRRAQCEQVAAFCHKSALRDVNLAELAEAKTALDAINPELYQRAHHVISESERTQLALSALNENDMKSLSALMAQSHLSLKEDFAVTTPELDYLVELLSDLLGESGGARMTGGGFGGCVVAILPKGMVAKAKQVIAQNYQQHTGLMADIYLCSAEQGAFTC